jgi:RimJ/RimL family protein N-acetyltransferase
MEDPAETRAVQIMFRVQRWIVWLVISAVMLIALYHFDFITVRLASIGLGVTAVLFVPSVVTLWYLVWLNASRAGGAIYGLTHLLLVVGLTPVALVGLFTIPSLVFSDMSRWAAGRPKDFSDNSPTVGFEAETETVLTDGVILLRPSWPEDAEALCRAVQESVTELSRWAPWCPPDYGMSHCLPWLETREEARAAGEEFDFVILDARTEQVLGGCGINQVNRMHNFANLGYWVRTSRTGEGLAPAAARLVARFGFEQLGFTRLEIVVSEDNPRSQRVAEKVGAVREGIARNRHVIRDRIDNAVVFSLIPEDLGEGARNRPA